MTVEPEIITKDARGARREPAPRERYLDGAVNLARFRRDAHWGLQSSRVVDVVRTVDAAVGNLAESIIETIAASAADTWNDLTVEIEKLARRIEHCERDNAALRAANAGLTRKVERLREPAAKARKAEDEGGVRRSGIARFCSGGAVETQIPRRDNRGCAMIRTFKRRIHLRERAQDAAAGMTAPKPPSQPRGLACAGMWSALDRLPPRPPTGAADRAAER